MHVSHCTAYLATTSFLLALLIAVAVHARLSAAAAGKDLDLMSRQVRTLELTDLCLFSEASYTRNLSLADRFTPFQDSPMTFEHFPSGAVAGPPTQLIRP